MKWKVCDELIVLATVLNNIIISCMDTACTVLHALKPAEFIRSLTSQNVTRGTTAQLYCQADADAVFWRVNGSSLIQLDVRGIREGTTTIGDGPPLHTLYVEATQELNNTIISCIAVHFDPNVNNTLSEPALFRVQGNDFRM